MVYCVSEMRNKKENILVKRNKLQDNLWATGEYIDIIESRYRCRSLYQIVRVQHIHVLVAQNAESTHSDTTFRIITNPSKCNLMLFQLHILLLLSFEKSQYAI